MFFISRPAAFVLFFLLLCSSVPAQEPPFTATRNKKAEFLFGQALQQHQMLDYSKALSTLDKCIKLDPEFVDAWMLIADIHGKNENYGKSIEIYEKVKTIRPEFPLAYFSLANDAFKSADYERAYENIEKYLQMPDYFQPDLIIASPSKRSSKTARIVAEELGMDTKLVSFESELYEAGIDKVLHVIRNIDDRYNTVMLVGHNPVFTGIVGFLTNSFLEHLPTSGIAVVRFDTATWKIIKHYTGELVHTDSPKNMRA
jgi:phosphohistidine phosphatase